MLEVHTARAGCVVGHRHCSPVVLPAQLRPRRPVPHGNPLPRCVEEILRLRAANRGQHPLVQRVVGILRRCAAVDLDDIALRIVDEANRGRIGNLGCLREEGDLVARVVAGGGRIGSGAVGCGEIGVERGVAKSIVAIAGDCVCGSCRGGGQSGVDCLRMNPSWFGWNRGRVGASATPLIPKEGMNGARAPGGRGGSMGDKQVLRRASLAQDDPSYLVLAATPLIPKEGMNGARCTRRG